jgi:RNA polymerase sigma-70 factor, ECF subfamily
LPPRDRRRYASDPPETSGLTMPKEDEAAQTFEPHRRHLTGLAYRMLGSLAEAEDIVQDAYLRWHSAGRGAVANPRAYLSSTVARLCLDHVKSARVRRETYVGPWLPEPIVDASALAPDAASELADDISVALMLTLERLSPPERAAFVLHDVFDMDFEEIAKVLDRKPAACRQLAARARAHVHDAKPRFNASAEETVKLSKAFYEAIRSGDIMGFGRLLAEDAILYTDGGGKRPAPLRPIRGSDKIVRFFTGIARKGRVEPIAAIYHVALNGRPGFVFIHENGTVETLTIEIHEGLIAAIYSVRNPEKLVHIARSMSLTDTHPSHA